MRTTIVGELPEIQPISSPLPLVITALSPRSTAPSLNTIALPLLSLPVMESSAPGTSSLKISCLSILTMAVTLIVVVDVSVTVTVVVVVVTTASSTITIV